MLNFYCSHCGQNIDADDSFAGMQAECPSCGNGIQVPATPASPAMPPPVQAAVPSPVAAAEKPKPRGKRFAWIATVIAFAILCRGAFPYAQDYVPGVVGGVLMALVFMVMLVLLAALPALLAGVLALAFKKPFRSPLYLTYSIALLPLAVLFLLQMNSMTDSYRRSREHQAVWDKNYLGLPDTGPNEIERALQESEAIIAKTNQELEEYDRRIAAEAAAASEQEKSPVPAQAPPEAAEAVAPALPATGDFLDPMDELLTMKEVVVGFEEDMLRVRESHSEAMLKERRSDLLDLDRVGRDPGLRQTKPRFARIQEITRRHAAEASRISADLPARLERNGFQKPFSRRAVREFSELLEESRVLHKQMWDAKLKQLEIEGEILDLLDATRADWKKVDGEYEFTGGAKHDTLFKLGDELELCKLLLKETDRKFVKNEVLRTLNAELPEDLDPAAKSGPEADREFGEVKQVAWSFLGATAMIGDQYSEVLRKEEIAEILNFDRVARDKDLSDSKARLAQLRVALGAAQEELEVLLRKPPLQLHERRVTEPLQHRASPGITKALKVAAPLYWRKWELESESIAIIEETLEFLQVHRGTATHEAGLLLSPDEELRKRYWDLTVQLETKRQEGEKLLEKLTETFRDSGLF